MQVTTASFLPGACGSEPCQSRFSDGSLVQGHEPNLFSEVLNIRLIINEELIDVGRAFFLAG